MSGSDTSDTSTSVDLERAPSALGAAATLPGERRKQRRTAARNARRAASANGGERPDLVSLDGGSGVVKVYEPRSGSSTPLPQYVRELWDRRPFLVALAKSELRGSRSSTALGAIWGLLDPLFQAMIYYMLFTIIRGGEGDSRGIDFLPLLVGGIFLFKLATSAMNEAGSAINKSSSLMLSSSFPRALLPLASLYKGLLEFMPTIVVFAGVYLWLGPPLDMELLWVPLLFAIQLVMSVGLALGTCTLVVFFKDTEKVLNYVTRILFFTTPVIYPLTLLPENLRSILVFQPFFPLFANYQMVFGGNQLDPMYLLYSVLWAVGFVLVGSWLFLRTEQEMAARL